MASESFDFKTLLKTEGKYYSEKWSPSMVPHYIKAFRIDTTIENSAALTRNLAYNMQYLEFLNFEFQELNLHSVIIAMLIKTYVITGMSIIEGLFTNIIRSHGWQKTSKYESLGTALTNEAEYSGEKYVIKTELLKPVEEHNTQMDFDALIKILNNHHEALKVHHDVYPALKRLKDFRNRIHLQKNNADNDHDYNAFDFKVKNEMDSILYQILTSSMVTDTPEAFDFLKPQETEE